MAGGRDRETPRSPVVSPRGTGDRKPSETRHEVNHQLSRRRVASLMQGTESQSGRGRSQTSHGIVLRMPQRSASRQGQFERAPPSKS